MGTSELKESLLDQQQNQRTSTNWFSCCVVLTISFSSLVLFACLTWPNIFLASQNIAVKLPDVRVHHYNPQGKGHNSQSSIYYKIQYATDDTASVLKKLSVDENKKLVCYYSSPYNDDTNDLYPKNIDPYLCTHLNVGMVNLVDNQIHIDEKARKLINETLVLRRRNKNLKLILWVGGAASKGFPEMVSNHSTRKIFIRSLRHVLKTYSFDGVDIDWEFPTAFRKERQHFSQLLYEIRKEYEREHRNYLLSIAVAAPEGLAYFAYDIIEINKYVDYVNIMTYDYYFYSKSSPFTGLNSPLYKRQSEHSVLSTLNIDHSVNYWSSKGLNKSKIVVGLPTYGHSFRLVNPFNHGIGSPAEDFGRVGTLGFASYSEVCWFKQNNIYVTTVYDVETCSPYMYAGVEWISYEDERSIECKARYVKENGFGGVMIFSLNTDDYGSHCQISVNKPAPENNQVNSSFPLVRKIYSVLFDKEN